MGPTYLVLLLGHTEPYSSALVLHHGTDEATARIAYDEGVRVHGSRTSFPHVAKGTVYLATVRAEARLS